MRKLFLASLLSIAASACGGAQPRGSSTEVPTFHPPLSEPVYRDARSGETVRPQPGSPNQYESWEPVR